MMRSFQASLLVATALLLSSTAAYVVPPASLTNNAAMRSVSVQPSMSMSIRNMPHVPSFWQKNKAQATSNIINLSMSAAATQQVPSAAKSDRKKRLAAGMAFLTGWADVFLFNKYRTFCTMMTGNTMWMANAVIEQNLTNVGYYMSVICSYLCGLAIFRHADMRFKENTMKVCAILVSFLFVGSDVWYHYLTNGSRWVAAMMLACGYGIINSAGMEETGTLTFVITGHMTKLVNQLIDRVSRTAGRLKMNDGQKFAFKQNTAVVSSFFGGAMWACYLINRRQLLNSFGVFSTIGILYSLLFFWQDMASLGGAWWLRKDNAMCELDDDGKVCLLPEEDGEQK
eukprot:CAMPEP_0195292116 /NCGR_PEP_ID=MMETSP0707-20130614/8622_1 /TAXON_ID=33640 /ORGANISM="Asterionellopsis glacialis, Strain CCMP134" /LENGTH=340 /DNA_ID=CAMNT_0040352511 /DNA_START=148 /DNA_END=1170 /DNA_ORIENTATION=-